MLITPVGLSSSNQKSCKFLVWQYRALHIQQLDSRRKVLQSSIKENSYEEMETLLLLSGRHENEKALRHSACRHHNDTQHNDSQHKGLNETAHLKKYKPLFEYQHLLLLRDIWWSKF